MLKLEYPQPSFRLRHLAGRKELYDELRRKWVVLTPEEWVRQHLVLWLVQVHGVPAARIALERLVQVGERRRRFDLVVYDAGFKPWLLAECKSMEVPLQDNVLSQILSYHATLQAGVLLITNGHHAYAWQAAGQGWQLLPQVPAYPG